MSSLSTNLNPNLRALRERFSEFLRWWLAELAFLLPAQLRQHLNARRTRLLLKPEGQGLALIQEDANGSRLLKTLHPGGVDWPAELRALLNAHGKGHERCFVLPESEVLTRVLDLPLAAEENLAQVLSFEMDRHTPFRAGQVHYGFRIVERRLAQGRLRVRLAVILRPHFEEWQRRLRGWGLQVDRILAPGVPEVDVVPRDGPVSATGGSRSKALLVATIIVLLAALVATPMWFMRQWAVELNHEVVQVERAAREAERLREQHGSLRQQLDALLDRRTRLPHTVEVLDELARLLPDHTWVQILELTGERVVISGLSGSGSGLIEQIEASALFAGAQFVAPVTKDPQGRDLFRISARLNRRG